MSTQQTNTHNNRRIGVLGLAILIMGALSQADALGSFYPAFTKQSDGTYLSKDSYSVDSAGSADYNSSEINIQIQRLHSWMTSMKVGSRTIMAKNCKAVNQQGSTAQIQCEKR